MNNKLRQALAQKYMHNFYKNNGSKVIKFMIRVDMTNKTIYYGEAFYIEDPSSLTFECKDSNQMFEVLKANIKKVSNPSKGRIDPHRR